MTEKAVDIGPEVLYSHTENSNFSLLRAAVVRGYQYPKGGPMRRYETIVIVHPSLSQEDRQPFLEKMTSLVSEPAGLLVKLDEWGQKKLAYEIKKQTRGYYVLLEYCGDGGLVKELERNLRLDDRALKYMTVCIDKDADVDKLKAELEAEKKKQEEAAAAADQQPVEAEAVQPPETEAVEIPQTAAAENQAQDSAPEGGGKDIETEEPEDGSVQTV